MFGMQRVFILLVFCQFTQRSFALVCTYCQMWHFNMGGESSHLWNVRQWSWRKCVPYIFQSLRRSLFVLSPWTFLSGISLNISLVLFTGWIMTVHKHPACVERHTNSCRPHTIYYQSCFGNRRYFCCAPRPGGTICSSSALSLLGIESNANKPSQVKRGMPSKTHSLEISLNK